MTLLFKDFLYRTFSQCTVQLWFRSAVIVRRQRLRWVLQILDRRRLPAILPIFSDSPYFRILQDWWIIQEFPCHNSQFESNSCWDRSDRHHPSLLAGSAMFQVSTMCIFGPWGRLPIWRAYFVIGWLHNQLAASVLFQKKGKKGWEYRWVRHWQFEQPYEHHPIHIHKNPWTLAGFLCRCLLLIWHFDIATA